jgi:hypothetical protein
MSLLSRNAVCNIDVMGRMRRITLEMGLELKLTRDSDHVLYSGNLWNEYNNPLRANLLTTGHIGGPFGPRPELSHILHYDKEQINNKYSVHLSMSIISDDVSHISA